MLSCVWLFVTPWSLPGSSLCGIFQARILEQVAISYSRISSWPRDRTKSLVSPTLASRFFTFILSLFFLLYWHHLGSPKRGSVKVAQLCLTLSDPIDYTVHGILQARIIEWVAFPFSRGSSNPGVKPRSPALQVDSLLSEPSGKPILRLNMPTFTNFLLEIRIRQGQSLSFLITFYKNFSRSKYN